MGPIRIVVCGAGEEDELRVNFFPILRLLKRLRLSQTPTAIPPVFPLAMLEPHSPWMSLCSLSCFYWWSKDLPERHHFLLGLGRGQEPDKLGN